MSPVRMAGPCVSIMMPTNFFRAADWVRMSGTTRRTQSCGACDMFRRKMFTPASMSLPIISAESVAGPSVAMIFVLRRLPRCICQPYQKPMHQVQFPKSEIFGFGRCSLPRFRFMCFDFCRTIAMSIRACRSLQPNRENANVRR